MYSCGRGVPIRISTSQKSKKAAFGLCEWSSKEEWIGGLEGPLLAPKREVSDALSKGVNQILFCCWLLFGRCSGEGGRLLDRRLLLLCCCWHGVVVVVLSVFVLLVVALPGLLFFFLVVCFALFFVTITVRVFCKIFGIKADIS